MVKLNRVDALQLVHYLTTELANPDRKEISIAGFIKEQCKPPEVDKVCEKSTEDSAHRQSLMAKLKSLGQAGFDAMTEDQYGDWVDSLSFGEFLELVSFCHDRDDTSQAAVS